MKSIRYYENQLLDLWSVYKTYVILYLYDKLPFSVIINLQYKRPLTHHAHR